MMHQCWEPKGNRYPHKASSLHAHPKKCGLPISSTVKNVSSITAASKFIRVASRMFCEVTNWCRNNLIV